MPNQRMFNRARLLTLAICALCLLVADLPANAAETRTVSFDSKAYHVDRIFRSMQGPIGRRRAYVGDWRKSELMWITAIRSEVFYAKDGTKAPDDFLCHANLGFGDIERHRALFQPNLKEARYQGRLFTLSQGQMDLKFPSGFGIPIISDEPFLLDTQALNLNRTEGEYDVVIRTSIDYVVDAELSQPMKPLFQKAAQGMVLVEGKDGYYGLEEGNAEEHGEGCSVGSAAGGENVADPFGRVFSAHWQVEPGRQVNSTPVTEFLEISYDTTVHYVSVHLHPFAQSLSLRDLTTGETVLHAEATSIDTGIGLKHVETITSEEGVRIFADHKYELVSVYENTTDQMQDSMAVMFLYLHDKEFVKPVKRTPSPKPKPSSGASQ
jgi:hypothetical protein